MKTRNENLTLHILAALLALVLWSFVKTADLPTRADGSQTFGNIPLEVRNVPAGLQLTNQLPATVNVTLRGPVTTLEQVNREQIGAYVSLQQVTAGTVQVAVKVVAPEGLAATANPPRVEVRLEQVLSADFTVKPLIAGNTGESYADVVISPATVKVTGIRSQLTAVSNAVVLVDLQGVNAGESLELQLPVKLQDTAGQELEQLVPEPGTVEARVRLLPGKSVTVSPVFQGELAQGYQIDRWEIDQVSIRLFGAAADLESLQSIETIPIDLTGVSNNKTITVPLTLPAGVVAVQPIEVEVAILVKRSD